jgi:hypothetical protein
MTADIIAPRFRANKNRGPFSIHLAVQAADGSSAGVLAPTERVLVSYEIADAAAAALAHDGDIASGHRAAMYAHLGALLRCRGPAAIRDYIETLSAMVDYADEPV